MTPYLLSMIAWTFVTFLIADEIESLIQSRKEPGNDSGKKLIGALLGEMDGKRKNVYVIANTNEPSLIDASFSRRFEKWIHIKLPSIEDITMILSQKFEKYPTSIFKSEIPLLAEKMFGYSPADIDRLFSTLVDSKDEQLESASHYVKDRNGHFWGCKPTVQGAEPIPFETVQDHEYHYSAITYQDFLNVLSEIPPTNSIANQKIYDDFEAKIKKNQLWNFSYLYQFDLI